MSDVNAPSNVTVAKRRRQDDNLGQREPLPVDVEEVVEVCQVRFHRAVFA